MFTVDVKQQCNNNNNNSTLSVGGRDKLPVPERPTIWMIVGQGPTALAVGAGGGCLDILLSSILSLLSLSLRDGPI